MLSFIVSLAMIEFVIIYFQISFFAAIWVVPVLVFPVIFPFRKAYLSFNFRVTIPLLFGVMCLVLARELSLHPQLRETIKWLDNAYTHNENFYSVLSTLYAVFTALILVKVIEDYDNLGQSIQKEASKIRTILQFLKYFKDIKSNAENSETVAQINHLFYEYIEAVLTTKGMGAEHNLSQLERCVEVVAKLETSDKNDEISLSQIMTSLDRLFMLRSQRISYMSTSISPYLLAVIIFMSLTILVPFYLSSEGRIDGNYYIIFTLGVAFAFLFNMILDIGSPHHGAWTVSLAPFEELFSLVKRNDTKGDILVSTSSKE